jgi:siroheme synthase (precorrin-2 oxidase/ferrochelatase)
MPRRAFPISLYLADRRVLVVTGDAVADDRIARLEDAGAEVVTLPPDAADSATSDALVGATALFAHTGDKARDRELAGMARDAGALAYAHDQPDISDFAMPAVARRGPLKIAISTGGHAPALARRLRELLDEALDSDEIDRLIDELVALRQQLPPERRGEIYDAARQLLLPKKFTVRK